MHSLTLAARRLYKFTFSLAALGLIFAGTKASAATLQEYLPLKVGDHYTVLTESGTTNGVVVQAGVAKYPGSFSLISTGYVSGTEYSTTGYVGYAASGASAVTYESDSGSNLVTVYTPPEVLMTEAALASLGTPFTGTSKYTNSFTEAGQTFETVTSLSITGVVSSTGTVSVIAGTFNNCLASEQTETTITTSTILGIGTTNTNTFNETVIYAPNVGIIKVIGDNGTNIEELISGVIGGVTLGGGGGGGTQKPTITITSPASGLTVTNNSQSVQGTAASSVGLADVYCRVDGGAWSAAHGTTNWSFTASLSAGMNAIEAYAADTAGNLSTTDTVTIIYATTPVSGTLVLRTNGMGSITRTFKGSTLMVGKSYTVTAVPGPGQVFAGWTGDIVASTNPLTFKMPSTLTLQANFNVNPFTALQGTYSGLFLGTNVVGPTNSGAFTLILTSKGAYTGKLSLGGSSLSLMGAFSAAGLAQETIGPSSLNPVALTLQLDLPTGQQVAGSVGGKGWGAMLQGYRAAYNATTNPAPVGNYTLLLAGYTNPVAPEGYSFGTAAVTAGGQVTFKGTLADGTTILPTVSSLLPNGLWPFYLSLYKGHGLMIGWIGLTNPVLTGMAIDWVKTGAAGGSYYPGGFSFETEANGYKYVAPAAGYSLLNWTSGVVTLTGGNLTTSLTNPITVNAKNQVQVTGPNADKLKLTLTPATGAFSGSFVPPGATKPVSINGVVLTDNESAGGFFLGAKQGGSVSIGKQP
ncbi:MAG TPA: Ig-like domain-containing protein [Dongiaceae bacterium]|nr:Ig-like domain-containing protein [Dongiaceae bacterium]